MMCVAGGSSALITAQTLGKETKNYEKLASILHVSESCAHNNRMLMFQSL